MGVSIPNTYEHDVDVTSLPTITVGSVGPVGPVTVNGIPDTYHIDITHLPKIQLSVDPLKIEPIDVSLRLKEIPSIRAHVPMNYCVGLSMLGIELVNVRLCGESQVITEPYRPNPCEVCDKPQLLGTLDPTHGVETVLSIRED
jgi:hypothetical protein